MILVTPGAGWWDGTPTVFTADAAGTTDLEDPPAALTYSWDWGDGSPLDSGELATHTYDAAGVYDVQLTVTDTGGMSASATFLVVVNSQAETLDEVDHHQALGDRHEQSAAAFDDGEFMTSHDPTSGCQSVGHVDFDAFQSRGDSGRERRLETDGIDLSQRIVDLGEALQESDILIDQPPRAVGPSIRGERLGHANIHAALP